jgi:DNA-binding response OmpR family regulator
MTVLSSGPMAAPRDQRTILLVEDDPSLAMGLVDSLEFEGFAVVHAKTGQEALELARRDKPDCVILDLMLPDLNGYQVCERIRHDDPAVPIVGELVARLRAVLRRASRGTSPPNAGPFRVGEALVDPASHTMARGREVHPLSFYEVELLRLLYERAGQPVSRDEILDKVWGVDANPTNRTVDNFIVRLRRKVEPQPDRPRHILTVYGVGYKLVP